MGTAASRICSVLILILFTGCAELYEPTPQIEKVEDTWLISQTAALSTTLVRTPKSDIITCSAPPPDTAFNLAEAADVNISLISVGGGDSDAEGESELVEETELAGRTPAVMLSRELFYRACEFSQNYKLSKDEALALYNKTLEIIDKNWSAEAAQTTVTIGDTITTTQGATISSTVNQTESQTGTTSSSTSGTSTTSGSDSTDSTSE